MRKIAGLGAGPAVGLIALAVAALVAAGGYLYRGAMPEPEATQPAASTPEATEPAAPEAIATVRPAPATEDSAAQASPPEPETPATPDMPMPPAIDTFRMEPDGQMIIAGRGTPGWDVSILIDEDTMGSAAPDRSGKFVQFLEVPSSSVPRILTLTMRSTEDGREVSSSDEILIAPTPQPAPSEAETASLTETSGSDEHDPEDRGDAPTEAPAEDAPDIAQSAPALRDAAAVTTQSQAPATQAAAAPEAVSPPEPQQPTVLLSNESGVRVVQAPQERAPEVMSSVALDAITYSETGKVQLSGRGRRDGFVRIYLDNQPITTSRIEKDGVWQSALPEVDTGVYTLRVDEVGPAGDVISRVETPFKREHQAILATRNQNPDAPRLDVVTVQPGSTLWAISRERYGEGILYVRVFEANRDRIRDPDLIYPGQMFELPE